jgi:hypothetical protein
MTTPIQQQVSLNWLELLDEANVPSAVRQKLASVFDDDNLPAVDVLLVLFDTHSGDESA